MKKAILVFFILLGIIGCARTWMYQPIEKFRPCRDRSACIGLPELSS